MAPAELNELCQKLLMEQQELAKLSLSPYQEQEWVRNKIYPKWEKLLSGSSLWNQSEINPLLDRLSKSLRTGMNFDLLDKLDGLPSKLLGRWSKLAYVQITSGNLFQLDEVIQLVEQPMLPVRHKEQMLRVLKSLRALVHTIPEVEEKAARILQSLRYGSWAEDEFGLGLRLLETGSDGELGMSLTY